MGLIDSYIRRNPEIKLKILRARINKNAETYIKESLILAFMFALMLTISIYLFSRGTASIIVLILSFIAAFLIIFHLAIHRIDSRIKKISKEIDQDIIYAGRFLLIKLSAGRPLINTIIDVSKTNSSVSKYFMEIVKDIEVGISIEDALQRAIRLSPSKKFRKILFQINNALKVGIDVTRFLEATIEEIEEEQYLEIKRYGKKLSSVTLMYLLFGIVIPSLGLSLASVIGTLLGLEVSSTFFSIMLLFIILVQLSFTIIFHAIRPNINL